MDRVRGCAGNGAVAKVEKRKKIKERIEMILFFHAYPLISPIRPWAKKKGIHGELLFYFLLWCNISSSFTDSPGCTGEWEKIFPSFGNSIGIGDAIRPYHVGFY